MLFFVCRESNFWFAVFIVRLPFANAFGIHSCLTQFQTNLQCKYFEIVGKWYCVWVRLVFDANAQRTTNGLLFSRLFGFWEFKFQIYCRLEFEIHIISDNVTIKILNHPRINWIIILFVLHIGKSWCPKMGNRMNFILNFELCHKIIFSFNFCDVSRFQLFLFLYFERIFGRKFHDNFFLPFFHEPFWVNLN